MNKITIDEIEWRFAIFTASSIDFIDFVNSIESVEQLDWTINDLLKHIDQLKQEINKIKSKLNGL